MSANGPQPYGVRAHVDAWQVTTENLRDVATWCNGTVFDEAIDFPDARDSTSTAEIGDWVVRGVTGLFSALPERWFHEHYYREDRPAKVTHGVLTGEALRINDRREEQR